MATIRALVCLAISRTYLPRTADTCGRQAGKFAWELQLFSPFSSIHLLRQAHHHEAMFLSVGHVFH